MPPPQEQAPAAKALSTTWGIIPHFRSGNIQATIKFYTEQLHFKLGGTYPPAPAEVTFCSIWGGHAHAIKSNIYFFQTKPGETLHPSAAGIALGTDAVDQYYDLLKAEGGVEIVDDIADREWGYRQFTVRDPDGNQLQFFRFLEGGNPGSE